MCNKEEILKNVKIIYNKTEKFNTTRIAFNFILPLNEKEIAANALVPYLLTSCGKNYPDFQKLNLKLLDLYNADIGAVCDFNGDNQLLKIYCSFLNDEVTEEKNEEKAVNLLLDLIFNPRVENGAFLKEDVEREKHLTAEKIKALFNEKRKYALAVTVKDMFKNEPYGNFVSGNLEDVLALTGETLYNAYINILKKSTILINVIGSKEPAGIKEKVLERLSKIDRDPAELNETKTENGGKVNEITEYAEIAKAKMVLGFKGEKPYNILESAALSLFTDILGGGPYSKLFTVVREKMSLCYYCAARSKRSKGYFTIDCGVDVANIEKAKAEILNQLELIKKGEISLDEILSSKTALKESLYSLNDSQSAIENWITVNENYKHIPTNQDVMARIDKVNINDIVNIAKTFKLSTVYLLLPKQK